MTWYSLPPEILSFPCRSECYKVFPSVELKAVSPKLLLVGAISTLWGQIKPVKYLFLILFAQKGRTPSLVFSLLHAVLFPERKCPQVYLVFICHSLECQGYSGHLLLVTPQVAHLSRISRFTGLSIEWCRYVTSCLWGLPSIIKVSMNPDRYVCVFVREWVCVCRRVSLKMTENKGPLNLDKDVNERLSSMWLQSQAGSILHSAIMFDIRHGPTGERNMLQQLDDYANANWDLLLCLSYSGVKLMWLLLLLPSSVRKAEMHSLQDPPGTVTGSDRESHWVSLLSHPNTAICQHGEVWCLKKAGSWRFGEAACPLPFSISSLGSR